MFRLALAAAAASVIFATLGMSSGPGAQEDVKAPDAKMRKLLEQQRDVLRELATDYRERLSESGDRLASLRTVGAVESELMEAELALAERPQQRAKIVQDFIARMDATRERVSDRLTTTHIDLLEIKVQRLKGEILQRKLSM